MFTRFNRLSTAFVLWIILAFLVCLTIFLAYKLVYQVQKIHSLEQQTHSLEQRSENSDKLFTSQLDGLHTLFMLEEGLLRLIPGLVSANDPEKENAMHRLVTKLLIDAIRTLPHVYGASLFLPNLKREELSIWESHNIAPVIAICYVGPSKPDRKRGVAGEAFMNQDIIIVHKTGERSQDGGWKFDRDSYIDFNGSGVPPPFNAFACVPLVEKKGFSESLGVVCFDSSIKDAFDDPTIQEHLKLIGRCFTSALLVYQEITRDQIAP